MRAQLISSKYDPNPNPEAIESAKTADVVVMVLGITSDLEGEEMPVSEEGFKGGDRISIDLPRPEETLRLQGDLAGARKLQEEPLNIRRRVLGPEHPDTSISAWNLIRTLQDLGDGSAARALLKRDLLWLLDRDPTAVGADLRTIREYVAQTVKKNG